MVNARRAVLVAVLAVAATSVVHARGIDIAVYTETAQWIGVAQAQEQGNIVVQELQGKPGINDIAVVGGKDLKQWAIDHTVPDGGHIIVQYGDLAPSIYPDGNAKPDGSPAEEFLDAGNTFANSNDYFFWGLNGRNKEGGLQNMIDVPGIVQWDDDTPMQRTAEGKKIAPDIPSKYSTDRPFHVDQLSGDWELEVALGSNSGDQKGTRCDPCIIHNKKTNGRLIQVFQTNGLEQPEGKVLAEIILNYYLDAVGGLAVEPQGKLPVTWGELKARR